MQKSIVLELVETTDDMDIRTGVFRINGLELSVHIRPIAQATEHELFNMALNHYFKHPKRYEQEKG